MSNLSNLLEEIKTTRGTNAKKALLAQNQSNILLLRYLSFALDPFIAFHVVKVPKTKEREENLTRSEAWDLFFETIEKCANRDVTGNAAINSLSTVFKQSRKDQEKWMRAVLKKHISIGVSNKTVNAIFPGLIPSFDVSLAQKFDFKRIKSNIVAVEPKLDGIRCFAIVKDKVATLYARSGKRITNFDETIGKELAELSDGCYDGEIMGEDFTSLMRQAYRKDDVDLSGTYFGIFDYLPLKEWETKTATTSCFERYDLLAEILSGEEVEAVGMGSHIAIDKQYLKLVKRRYLRPTMDALRNYHDECVDNGYEGAMIKDPDAPYKFGRGYEVMKYKAFHDVDLPIKQLLEGTGKHSGKLGSVVVCFKGVDVQVGSGFSDEIREAIWKLPEAFIGRVIEVRYQEVTPDGSLRFPTFVCFRNDK